MTSFQGMNYTIKHWYNYTRSSIIPISFLSCFFLNLSFSASIQFELFNSMETSSSAPTTVTATLCTADLIVPVFNSIIHSLEISHNDVGICKNH